MLEQYLYEKKKVSEVLIENSDQKEYLKGKIEMIDEILEEIKKRPIPFNPWLMPF